jgi:hypothetical protein
MIVHYFGLRRIPTSDRILSISHAFALEMIGTLPATATSWPIPREHKAAGRLALDSCGHCPSRAGGSCYWSVAPGVTSCLALLDGVTSNLWALSTSTGRLRQLTDFGEQPIFITRRVSWSSDGGAISPLSAKATATS